VYLAIQVISWLGTVKWVLPYPANDQVEFTPQVLERAEVFYIANRFLNQISLPVQSLSDKRIAGLIDSPQILPGVVRISNIFKNVSPVDILSHTTKMCHLKSQGHLNSCEPSLPHPY
jgi:hypothetical protein